MRWARVAVVLGAVLLAVGFGLAVTPTSVVLDGQEQPCDFVLDPGRLVGQPEASAAGLTAAELRGAARVDAACGPVERRTASVAWGVIGLGALVLLAGWTAVGEVGPTGRTGVRRTGARVAA